MKEKNYIWNERYNAKILCVRINLLLRGWHSTDIQRTIIEVDLQ